MQPPGDSEVGSRCLAGKDNSLPRALDWWWMQPPSTTTGMFWAGESTPICHDAGCVTDVYTSQFTAESANVLPAFLFACSSV